MAIKLAVVTAIDISFKVLLLAQMKAAKDAGFEVYGICTKGPNFDSLRSYGIKMHAITIKRSISPLSDLVAIWKMYRYFKRENITIVHTHFAKAGLLGRIAAKLAGVPSIIHTLHGFYLHENMSPLMKLKRIYLYVSRELPLRFIGMLTNWIPDTPLVCFLRGFFSYSFFKRCGRDFQYGAHVCLPTPHTIEMGDNE